MSNKKDDDKIGTVKDKSSGRVAPLVRASRSGLTPEMHDRIVAQFREDPSPASVAASVGVPRSTLHRWLQKGNNGHPAYERFALDVAAARNLHRVKWMANLREIADGDSRDRLAANRLLLSRQFRDEWGDRDTVALEEHETKKKETDYLSTLTPEELALLKSINAKRLAAENDEPND